MWETQGAAVQHWVVLVAPSNHHGLGRAERCTSRHGALAEPRLTGSHWHRQRIGSAGVVQTVGFWVYLIGQKLPVCGESAVTRTAPGADI